MARPPGAKSAIEADSRTVRITDGNPKGAVVVRQTRSKATAIP